jgi:two-component system, OmpR family, response regulator
MSKVLIIDDDVELCEMLREYIAGEGYQVTIEHDPELGTLKAVTGQADIVVLDVMMPKMNGIEVLRHIREKTNLPVIMLTANGDDDSRVAGLELGADDYVPKPCTPREIVARIRAIFRRLNPEEKVEQINVGRLSIWPKRRYAEWNSKPVELTSTEFSLLEVLAKNAGTVVNKNELSLQALGRPLAKFDRSIDVHMSSIRQKLGIHQEGHQYIQTIYRMGYQLVKE